MPKVTVEDIVTTEFNGDIFTGRRVITGTRVKYQTIYYKDKKSPDSKGYTREDQHLMPGQAIIILWQMV